MMILHISMPRRAGVNEENFTVGSKIDLLEPASFLIFEYFAAFSRHMSRIGVKPQGYHGEHFKD